MENQRMRSVLVLEENTDKPEETEEVSESEEVTSLDHTDETSYLESLTRGVHDEAVSNENMLGFYFRIVRSYKLLPHHEVMELARLVKERGDLEARNKIVLHNLRLAIHIAGRYRDRGVDYLDLIQEGVTGLIIAADRFDYTQGFHFSTYAQWWVRSTIMRAIQEYGHIVRKPVHIHESWNTINQASVKLIHKFRHKPSAEEIAREISQPVKKVKHVLRSMRMSTVFLEDLIQNSDGESGGLSWESVIEGQYGALSPEQLLEAEDELKKICFRMRQILSCVHSFSPRAHDVFCLRFGLNGTFEAKTLEETAKPYKVTRERIRQIIREACLKLAERGFELEIDETWLQEEVNRMEKLRDLLGMEIPAETFSVESLPNPLPIVRKLPTIRKETISNPILSPEEKPKVSDVELWQVIEAVCEVFEVSHHVILGHSRAGKAALTRQVVMFLLRFDLDRSFPQIGKDLKKDHSTVMHGCKHIQERIECDEWLFNQIGLVRKKYCK